MVLKNPDQIFSAMTDKYVVNLNYYGWLDTSCQQQSEGCLPEKLQQFNQTLPESSPVYGSVTAFVVRNQRHRWHVLHRSSYQSSLCKPSSSSLQVSREVRGSGSLCDSTKVGLDEKQIRNKARLKRILVALVAACRWPLPLSISALPIICWAVLSLLVFLTQLSCWLLTLVSVQSSLSAMWLSSWLLP